MKREEAIALAKTEFWKEMSDREIAEFQISEELMCLPFSVFHEALEKTLGRAVFTHEFGLNVQGLKDELFKGKKPPTLEEIINMIPEEKRILVFV